MPKEDLSVKKLGKELGIINLELSRLRNDFKGRITILEENHSMIISKIQDLEQSLMQKDDDMNELKNYVNRLSSETAHIRIIKVAPKKSYDELVKITGSKHKW